MKLERKLPPFNNKLISKRNITTQVILNAHGFYINALVLCDEALKEKKRRHLFRLFIREAIKGKKKMGKKEK